MLGVLGKQNFEQVEHAQDADVLVINTCAFIGPAKEESIEAILAAAKIKAMGEGKKLIVTGCLVQRYGEELARDIPEVDHFLGTGAFVQIGRVAGGKGDAPRQVLPDPDHTYDAQTPRVRSTPGGMAYLKIAEGCDNACAFCIIPQLRGPQKGRPIDDLVADAERLAAEGVKELNLIAQDLTAYGHDLPGRPHLADLLEGLAGVDGIEWIRMLYAYPRPIPKRFYEVFERQEKIVPYIDMPLQHITDRMLGIMKRPRNSALIRAQIRAFRERVGGARGEFTFRTTFIVGHPGETQEDFVALRDFIEETRFERMGVFEYSDEEDTAAYDLSDKVPRALITERRETLMELQRTISAEQQREKVGRTLEVLVEGTSDESDLLLQGRHRGQAPEIDGLVYINRGEAAPGDLVPVEISESGDYDLVGGIPGDWGDRPDVGSISPG